MALARAVSFDGVSKDRIEELKREMSDGEQPEGLAATEVIMLARRRRREIARDPLLRDRRGLQARRRDPERDAGR